LTPLTSSQNLRTNIVYVQTHEKGIRERKERWRKRREGSAKVLHLVIATGKFRDVRKLLSSLPEIKGKRGKKQRRYIHRNEKRKVE